MKRALWAALLLALPVGASADVSLVVYLPATPVESAARVGEAVTDLGAYLSRRVPGLAVTARPFRRAEDATSYLQSADRNVALLLTDASFLMDVPADLDVVPAFRIVRGGKETQRKLVVVGPGETGRASLADLKGRTLSVAMSGGESSSRFLSRAVFDGELNAATWFGKLVPETDEFSATANALFGRADAALVSEDNPLLQAHLGKELKTVYTSPPLSLPILAYRTGALTAAQQSALDAALLALAGSAEDKKILDGLRIDGFARVKDGRALLALPAAERRQPEVAVASARDLGLPALPAPEAAKTPFLLGFSLPELPMPVLDVSQGR